MLAPVPGEPLKIITWNVNSLKARAELVTRFIDETRPDVLCLQELKLETDKVPTEIFTSRGYHLAVHGQRQWNGVLIASKTPLTDVVNGLPDGDEGQSRMVAATTAGLRIVNLYCPQGSSVDSPKFQYKLSFFDALIADLRSRYTAEDALVVLGDINIAPKAHDVHDPEAMANVPTFHPLEHQRWKRLLELGLEDAVAPHIDPGEYSFWDYRAASFRLNQGFRIDHVLVTECVGDRVMDAWIDRPWRKKREERTPSDHAPVGIRLTSPLTRR